MSKLIRESLLSRKHGESCRIQIKERGDGRLFVGAYMGSTHKQPIYSSVAGDDEAISELEALRFLNEYRDRKLSVGWFVSSEFVPDSHDSFDDVERLFGTHGVYHLKRGGGGKRVMRQLMADLNLPADLYTAGERMIGRIPSQKSETMDMDAPDFPFVLHFALAGCLAIKRNGRTLDHEAMRGLVDGAKGRVAEVLAALGRVTVLRSRNYNFSAAIGIVSHSLAL